MKSNKVLAGAFGVTCLFWLFGQASAATYQSTTGLTSPTEVITFSEVALADFQNIGNAYSGFGVSFQNAFQFNHTGSTPYPNVIDDFAQNFTDTGCPGQPGGSCNPITMSFVAPITDVVFSLNTNSGLTQFQSFLGANLVESFSANTSLGSADNYFGFTSSQFDRIVISAGSNGAEVIDNLEFNAAATPIPTTLPLFASGLCAFGLLSWRRKRKLLTAAA